MQRTVTNDTTTISGISPFFIVADVPATLSFYRDMLGFEVTGDWLFPQEGVHACREAACQMSMFLRDRRI